MMRRGGWREAALTQGDMHVLVGSTIVFAVVRGFDYFLGDDPHLRSNYVAETVAPLDVWAVVLWAAAAALLIGWRLRMHGLVFTGHLVLGAVYACLSCGLIGSYIADLCARGWHPFALDGVKNIGPLAIIAMLHIMLAFRTGTHPLPHEEEVVDGEIHRGVNG